MTAMPTIATITDAMSTALNRLLGLLYHIS